MTIHFKNLLSAFSVAVLMIGLSGCQQLQAVFATRPSENMPAYKPVDVQFANRTGHRCSGNGSITPRKGPS